MMSISKFNWFSKNPDYSNKYCPYCGRLFSTFGSNDDIKTKTNKEHLIGRDFVPRDSFENPQNINFFFRSCNTCNNRKSNYERQVSTVSLYNSILEHSEDEQNRILDKAKKDYSGFEKGKKVIDTNTSLKAKIRTSFFNMEVGLSGPPQVSDIAIANLAFMHMQGLIGFVFQDTENRTMNNDIHLYKDDFFYYGYFSKDDWGNPSLEYLRNITEYWKTLLSIATANDNFKIFIRHNNNVIFWLLEWNKFYRVCGFISRNHDLGNQMLKSIPEEEYKFAGYDENHNPLYFRRSTPLKENSPDFIFK